MTVPSTDEPLCDFDGVFVKHLPFEFLPKGAWKTSDVIEYYARGDAQHVLGDREDKQRIISLSTLDPITYWVGDSGWRGYIVIEFQWSRSIVLECPVKANAAYILAGDWRSLLHESKGRLLTDYSHDTTKVVHKGDGLMRVRQALERNS